MTSLSGSYRTPRRTTTRPLALFLPDLAGGGGERITLTLGRALADLGLDVDLVVANGRGELRDDVPSEVNLVELGADRVRHCLPMLVRYLQVREPGWIMPTVDHANVVGTFAARVARTGTRVVLRPSTTLSRRIEGHAGPLVQSWVALSRHSYRTADAVVACSVGMAEDLAAYCAMDRERIDVIPNATLDPAILACARRPVDHPWFASGAPPVVLGVGRLGPPKDFGLLLEAFSRVRADLPARLVVLGDGPQRPALEARSRELGVAADVGFLGFDANPYRYMARAALFVLASQREGLPGALIEAMACGTPVVATDCPSGPAEILAGGRHGLLSPVGDVDALADAIRVGLTEPPRPGPDALAPYEPDTVAAAYLAVLERVSGATDAA